MPLVMLIISVALAILGFGSQRFRIKSIKSKCTILGLALLSLGLALLLAVLDYRASIETEEQLQLTQNQVDRAQARITEIRTPRRMEPETKRMLVARLEPYAGQNYDMKVFRDQDSLELASAIQAIFEEAGWVYTNVYPRHAKGYAETGDGGVWIISGKVETRWTSEARMALHGALNEAGMYDDSNHFNPENCVKATGPIQEGTKITRIPCSDSSIQSIEIFFTVRDDVIPDDTLVLHVGKERP